MACIHSLVNDILYFSGCQNLLNVIVVGGCCPQSDRRRGLRSLYTKASSHKRGSYVKGEDACNVRRSKWDLNWQWSLAEIPPTTSLCHYYKANWRTHEPLSLSLSACIWNSEEIIGTFGFFVFERIVFFNQERKKAYHQQENGRHKFTEENRHFFGDGITHFAPFPSSLCMGFDLWSLALNWNLIEKDVNRVLLAWIDLLRKL